MVFSTSDFEAVCIWRSKRIGCLSKPTSVSLFPHSLTVGNTTKISRTSATTVTVVTQTLPAWRCTCPHTPSNMPSCSPVASVTDHIPRYVPSHIRHSMYVWFSSKYDKKHTYGESCRLGECVSLVDVVSSISYTVYLYLWLVHVFYFSFPNCRRRI